MAFDMNEDRINRWKCLFCGSKHKKVIDHIRKSDGAHIGVTLHCCNCGHIDNFAWTMKLAKQLMNESEIETDNPTIKCGLCEKDLEYCKNLKCQYRPTIVKEKKPMVHSAPSTEISPAPVNIENDEVSQAVEKLDNLHMPNEKRSAIQMPIPTDDVNRLRPVLDESLVGMPYIPTYLDKVNRDPHHPPVEPRPCPKPIPRDNIERPGMNEHMKNMPEHFGHGPRLEQEPNLVIPVTNGSTGKI